jgi:hypothetical protein
MQTIHYDFSKPFRVAEELWIFITEKVRLQSAGYMQLSCPKTKSVFLPAMSLQRILMSVLVLCMAATLSPAQHSVTRQWNEMLLDAIRLDFARPTIHARNLFHVSAAMYDAWRSSRCHVQLPPSSIR